MGWQFGLLLLIIMVVLPVLLLIATSWRQDRYIRRMNRTIQPGRKKRAF